MRHNSPVVKGFNRKAQKRCEGALDVFAQESDIKHSRIGAALLPLTAGLTLKFVCVVSVWVNVVVPSKSVIRLGTCIRIQFL